jgi:glucose/mannose-6-phosphate isomerase
MKSANPNGKAAAFYSIEKLTLISYEPFGKNFCAMEGNSIYDTIRRFPEQLSAGWKPAQEADLTKITRGGFRRVIYAGMGGSSLPADLINDCLQGELSLHLIRDYRLPRDTDGRDLVIAASFSGNTEETLQVVADGLDRDAGLVAMSNGGRLKTLAAEKSIPFVQIPDCIQPRCATGYFFAGTLNILWRLKLIESKQSALEALASFLTPRQGEFENKGKEIARFLKDLVPIIYGPTSLYGALRIWKIKFNENAKIQSFFNVFPELNHNEMVGFTRLLMKPALIYLKSRFMHPRIARRMEVMRELLREKIPIYTLELTGADLLQETFESLAVADYASYHLAKAYGIDPAPVEMVEDFKQRLR